MDAAVAFAVAGLAALTLAVICQRHPRRTYRLAARPLGYLAATLVVTAWLTMFAALAAEVLGA